MLAVAALVGVSRKTVVPYPVLLVVGGLILALIPGMPAISIRPELVFLVFLPPLLYWESLTASVTEFKINARPIAMLAIGLVLVNTCLLALIAHAVIHGMTWPAAFVLGAVLAPTDEVAVSEVASRFALPRHVLSVLEGESLINDAVSLVAYRMALAAAVTGAFSLGRGCVQFLVVSLGGVAIGLAAGWIVGRVRSWIPEDPPVENTISLVTPFAAYLPAELLGVSGVIAVVTIGLYLGRLGPKLVSSRTRVEGGAMWGMVTFLMNGLLFILTGLELRHIREDPLHTPTFTVLGYAVILFGAVVAVRFVWVFGVSYAPWVASRLAGRTHARPTWKSRVVVAWVGIRGALSLVAALAIPIVVTGGRPFPDRSLIIAVSFYVILATLVLQGLSLPWLVKALHFPGDSKHAREEARARLAASRAGLRRLEREHIARTKARVAAADQSGDGGEPGAPAAHEPDETDPILEDLRRHYLERMERFTGELEDPPDEEEDARRDGARELRLELLDAERRAIIRLRDEGDISDDTLRRVQRDIDLEDFRLTPED